MITGVCALRLAPRCWRRMLLSTLLPLLLCWAAVGAAAREPEPELETAAPHGLAAAAELLQQGHYDEAAARARVLLRAAEAKHGADALEVGAVLNVLVEALSYGSEAVGPEPRALAQRALAIAERRLDADHPDVALALNNLAFLYWAAGEYEAGEPLYEQALGIRERALGPDHPDVALSLNNLAVLQKMAGRHGPARILYERALTIREQALGPDHPDVAFSLYNLAILLGASGELDAARRLQERALAIREKALGTEHPDYGSSLHALALVHEKMGDMARARQLYERAVAVREAALGPDHPAVAYSLAALATVLAESGDRHLARLFCERAVAIQEQALGAEHPVVASALYRLADLLAESGDVAGAAARERRVLAIRQQTLGPDHPDVAVTLGRLADFEWQLGDAAAAFEHALQAEVVARQHLRLTIRSLPERQALLYAAALPGSLDLLLSAAAGGVLPEAAAAAWDALIRARALVFDQMASRRPSAADGDPELAALWQSFTATSQRLVNLHVRGAGTRSAAALHQLLATARREREAAETALARRSAQFRAQEQLQQVGYAEIAAGLPVDSALLAYARFRQRAVPGKPGEVADGEPWSYLAFVLRADEPQPRVVVLGSAADIDDRIVAWREQVTGYAERRYRLAGEQLRRAIWDPVAPLLTEARHIFVVPEAELHRVSLVALPAGEGGYLVEGPHLFHYLSTERDLVAPLPAAAKTAANPSLLVLGGADFDAAAPFVAVAPDDPSSSPEVRAASFEVEAPAVAGRRNLRSSCESFRAAHFERLAASAREATEVAAIFAGERGSVVQLSGAAATETAFKRAASGHGVLHLATHGFFLGGRCPALALSSRSLSELGAAVDVPRPGEGESPLLLTGLALAGANQRLEARPGEDDGILTAEEIAALDLATADWAVLSACDTGGGPVRVGEGVFGLRRAFRLAGVRTLIMSLWKVDDEWTRRWMRALYTARFTNGLPTAQAVQRASREVLTQRRDAGLTTHPFYWAGFVAEGDWR